MFVIDHDLRLRFVCGPVLERLGWDVEVLSVDPKFYEESLDDELSRLVPTNTRITHTPAYSTRWTRRLGVGDIGMRAYFPMRRVLRERCREWRPDALFIPGGPFYTFGLGADASPVTVEIAWPSGTRQKMTNVKPDQHLTITEQ